MSAPFSLAVAAHPTLCLRAFLTTLPCPLSELPSPPWLVALLRPGPAAEAPRLPSAVDDALRGTVRDLLRYGGFKPTGRAKPSSEYLGKAAAEGALNSINAVVDAGNAVSLHSGLPISVVDVDRLGASPQVALAAAGARYVFNPAGQEIDVGSLLCLHDAEGPCANPVKDAMRSKTHPGTTRTLSLLWGHRSLEPQVQAAEAWYRELVGRLGASTSAVEQRPQPQ